MRNSDIERLKKEGSSNSLLTRLANLDYKFWVSWRGLFILVAFPVLSLMAWGCFIHMSNPAEPWGSFGDAFAPITSFFTALALEAAVITVLQQRKEIAEQKEEQRLLAKQSEITEEANELAKERLNLDFVLQYMQLMQLREALREAGNFEELETIEWLMKHLAVKFRYEATETEDEDSA